MNPFPAPEFNEYERELERFDPAYAKCSLALRGGLRFGHKPHQIRVRRLPEVVEQIDGYRRRFEEGEDTALLAALECSIEENLPLPSWLALALLARLRDYYDGKLLSLDEVFGAPYPSKGKAALRRRRDWKLGARLWMAAQYLKATTRVSFDQALRRAIERERVTIGLTKARALVKRVDEAQSRLLGRRSSMFARRTKR